MRYVRKIVNNPVLVVAALVAGLNAATVHTWQGYASAALFAVVRWVVTGPLTVSPRRRRPTR